MDKASKWVRQFIAWEYAAISLIIGVHLLIGASIVTAYGMSVDEPISWAHAEWGWARYLGQGSGSFNEPGNGPGYFMLARVGVLLLRALLPGLSELAAWHFTYFLTFQLSAFFLYLLARRLASRTGASLAVLLYLSQPLLHGHAFINPKDTPFLALFLGAVVLGLRLVDHYRPPEGSALDWQALKDEWGAFLRRSRHAWPLVRALALAVALLLLAAELWGAGILAAAIGQLVAWFYRADAESLPGRLFGLLAANADSLPLEAYSDKWLALYQGWLDAWGGLLLLALLIAAICWIAPQSCRRLGRAMGATLRTKGFLPAAVLLGLAAATRTIGMAPLLVVMAYWALRWRKGWLLPSLTFSLAAALAAYLFWPDLWGDFLGSFGRYLSNVTGFEKWDGKILFEGRSFTKDDYPAYMLPKLILLQLTEPALLLAAAGMAIAAYRAWKGRTDRLLTLILLGCFFAPLGLAVAIHPVIYNAFRHFLFILPPLFVFAAIAMDALLTLLRRRRLALALLLLALLPGLLGILQLFPYEYAYYNSLAGGTVGAFRDYELDYWLLSYKEAIGYLNQRAPAASGVLVYSGPELVQGFARDDLRLAHAYISEIEPGDFDFIVISTNLDLDLSLEAEVPGLVKIHSISRNGVPLSEIYRMLP